MHADHDTPNDTPNAGTHADTHADQHAGHGDAGTRSMALSATLHCLTGCAIGEILGLVLGTALGLSTGWTIALAVTLAFLFGYALSTLPLLRAGVRPGTALSVVLAADTLSIATMEVVDNAVMALVPGAMDAGLVNSTFWLAMAVALTAAFVAAYPVNRHLLARGKGHALTHGLHETAGPVTGPRRFIPVLATPTLVAAVAAFMLGGLAVSLEAELGGSGPAGDHAASR